MRYGLIDFAFASNLIHTSPFHNSEEFSGITLLKRGSVLVLIYISSLVNSDQFWGVPHFRLGYSKCAIFNKTSNFKPFM